MAVAKKQCQQNHKSNESTPGTIQFKNWEDKNGQQGD